MKVAANVTANNNVIVGGDTGVTGTAANGYLEQTAGTVTANVLSIANSNASFGSYLIAPERLMPRPLSKLVLTIMGF